MLNEKTTASMALLTFIFGAAAGAVFGSAFGEKEEQSYYLQIPKDGLIQEAVHNGVSEQQLVDAFQGAAPEIVNREVKKLADLCKANKPLLSAHGIKCKEVLAAFNGQK